MALLDNLISYWKLDETSGNRFDSHGSNSLSENGTVSSATGLLNTAASGFTNTDYLSHTDNADLSVGDIDFTIQVWMYVTSYAFGGAVYKGDSNNLEYELNFNGSVPQLRVSSAAGFTNLTSDSWSPTSDLNTWYHVIGWHDSVNNEIGIAVNAGTPLTVSYSAGSYDSAGDFRVGNNPFNQIFPGRLDEVGFWKRVLTSAERTALYNGGAGLAYPFGEGGGGGGYSVWYSGSGRGALLGGGII